MIPRYDLEAVEHGILDRSSSSPVTIARMRRPSIGVLVGAAAAAVLVVAVGGRHPRRRLTRDDGSTTDDPTLTSRPRCRRLFPTVNTSPTHTEAPSPAPPASGGMWPQSSLDEVREAQELADAGDPAYTWQVDPQLSSGEWWAYRQGTGRGDRRAIPPRRAGLGPVPVQSVPGRRRRRCGRRDPPWRRVPAVRARRDEPSVPDCARRAPGSAGRRAVRTDDRRAPLRGREPRPLPTRPAGPRRDLGGEPVGDDRAVRADGSACRRGRGNRTPRGLPASTHRG